MAFKAYFCGKFFPAGPPHDEPPGDKGLDNRFDIPDEPRGDICDPCKPKFRPEEPPSGPTGPATQSLLTLDLHFLDLLYLQQVIAVQAVL